MRVYTVGANYLSLLFVGYHWFVLIALDCRPTEPKKTRLQHTGVPTWPAVELCLSCIVLQFDTDSRGVF